jgi:hypothetical protein
MAYAQWVVVNVKAKGTRLNVMNAKAEYGKFSAAPDKDREISAKEIDKIVVEDGRQKQIASCGRSDSPSGTVGSFDLYDGPVHVGTYHWNCPWGSKTNKSWWTSTDPDHYVTEATGANTDSGALGNISLTCVKVVES